MYARSNFFTIASTRARVSHGGFAARPEKNMLYSASRRFSSDSSRCRSRSVSVGGGTPLPRNQEPDEREPQLARMGDGPIVDEDLGAVVAADQLKQIAELRRVPRVIPRA